MRQYKVEMIISADGILDEWTSAHIVFSIGEDVELRTYGQVEVVEVQVLEVAE